MYCYFPVIRLVQPCPSDPGYSSHTEILGSLSNDDTDGNKDGKKAIGLDLQDNNFTRASHFLYISLYV